jgi:hypothetical protein
MLRIAGVSALFLVTGCLVSSDPDPVPTPPDLLGRICTQQLTTTGSFVQSVAPPANPDGTPYEGCWPIGTWTFTASVGDGDCETKPTVLAQYQFKAELMTDMDGNDYQVYTYMTDPSIRNRLKISQGGDGLCEGELNLFSTDGKSVWILKPELYADQHLGGNGEFQLYGSDQWTGADL